MRSLARRAAKENVKQQPGRGKGTFWHVTTPSVREKVGNEKELTDTGSLSEGHQRTKRASDGQRFVCGGERFIQL